MDRALQKDYKVGKKTANTPWGYALYIPFIKYRKYKNKKEPSKKKWTEKWKYSWLCNFRLMGHSKFSMLDVYKAESQGKALWPKKLL